jgi:hypothetical protein
MIDETGTLQWCARALQIAKPPEEGLLDRRRFAQEINPGVEIDRRLVKDSGR